MLEYIKKKKKVLVKVLMFTEEALLLAGQMRVHKTLDNEIVIILL